MTLDSLRAVDKAYEERDVKERKKQLRKEMFTKRDLKEQCQQQAAYSLTERIKEIKERESQDKALLQLEKQKVHILK